MGVYTGKDAYVSGVKCTQSWAFNRAAALTAYSASCTPGGVGQVEGNINVSGTMTGLGWTPPDPAFLQGTTFPFAAVANASPGSEIVYSGDVVMNTFAITFPVEAGGVVSWSSGYGAIGDLVQGSVLPNPLDSVPATIGEKPISAKSVKILVDTGAGVGDFVGAFDIPAIIDASITFTRAEKVYFEDGFAKRLVGNLSAALSFNIREEGLESMAAIEANVQNRLRLSIGDGSLVGGYWQFNDIMFAGPSGLEANASTQDIITQAYAGAFNMVSKKPNFSGQFEEGLIMTKVYDGAGGSVDFTYFPVAA